MPPHGTSFVNTNNMSTTLLKREKHSFFYRNGLTLSFMALLLICWCLPAYFGWLEYNQELAEKGQGPLACKEGRLGAGPVQAFAVPGLFSPIYGIICVALYRKQGGL